MSFCPPAGGQNPKIISPVLICGDPETSSG